MGDFIIRDIVPAEYGALGNLLVEVYAGLAGFPSREEQPGYYRMLADIGKFTEKPGTRVLVAKEDDGTVRGGVVCFSDMKQYGAKGLATTVANASGVRLLVVDPAFRRQGVGRDLTNACIDLAREKGHGKVVLHSTESMKTAWIMYEGMGFVRWPELDFMFGEMPVLGFRKDLE